MKKKLLLPLLLTMTCAFALIMTGCGEKESAVSDDLKVKCHNGVMVGQEENGVVSFLGVPYAEPPTGELRWKAPAAAAESSEEIICDEFGYTALQYEWPTEPASYEEKSEDCLTLNIWKGKDAGDDPKAVMVWFHGGSHSWGGTADPTYDGQNFVEAHPDVILVTANYRLGLMAWPDFSNFPGGEDYTDINLGIRDNIMALEWVQQNIEAFGGDPDNVTIFGESAGGGSAIALLMSPMSEGLFNKVIAESGSTATAADGVFNCVTAESGSVGPYISSREDAQEYAEAIAEAAGCETMDELLEVTGDEWMELDWDNELGDISCGLVADGEVIPYPEDMDEALKAAAERGIVIMHGTNEDEWNYFMTDSFGDTDEEKFESWKSDLDDMWNGRYELASDDQKAMMDEFYELAASKVDEEYAEDADVKDALIKSAFRTEQWRYSHIQLAEVYDKYGGEQYMYLWTVPSTLDEYYKSACHAIELAFVFNNLEDTSYTGDAPDEATAERTLTAWTNFAKTGNPSIEDAEWPAYDSTDRNTMVISLDGWKAESDPNSRERELVYGVLGSLYR